jgi:Tfp pilus assembly protein PilZ
MIKFHDIAIETKWLLGSLILGVFALGTIAQAKISTPESCGYVNLSEQLGPVRDQGDIGWCYANSAADLLTAKFKTGSRGVMSADQLAIIYNYSKKSPLSSEAGVTSETLKLALQLPHNPTTTEELLSYGFCPTSLEDEAFKMGPATSLTTKIARLKELKNLFDLGRTSHEKNQLFWSTYRSYVEQGSVLVKIPETFFLRVLEKSTAENFLLYFADLMCGQERSYNANSKLVVVDHPKQITYIISRKSVGDCSVMQTYDLLSEIHHELSSKKNILSANIGSNLIQINGNLEKPSSGHAVTVVGREWRNGSCQIIIRNSWGTQCDYRNSSGKTASLYSKYVQKCESGNLWVKEDDFYLALNGITYITESANGQDPKPLKVPVPSNELCSSMQ